MGSERKKKREFGLGMNVKILLRAWCYEFSGGPDEDVWWARPEVRRESQLGQAS